ncbi:lymphotoxin-alpha [Aulostomus maculatus]
MLSVVLLLLSSAVVAVLTTVVSGGLSCRLLYDQTAKSPDRNFNGIKDKQQKLEDLRNPSAMLTAFRGNQANGKLLKWEDKFGNAHCEDGFKYSNGSLVLSRSGKYRVFLQITYESKANFSCHGHMLTLLNQVFVFREAYAVYTLLLSSVDTVNCNMTPWIKSLYTDGLFVLGANSILQVKSSQPKLISKSEYLAFFGAELLPQ